MIHTYKEFIENIEKLKKDFVNTLKTDFDKEFSKYLKPKVVSTMNLSFNYRINDYEKVYLIDEHYGLAIYFNIDLNLNLDECFIEISPIYRAIGTSKWRYAPIKGRSQQRIFKPNGNENVEDFVKRCVKEFREESEKRNAKREERELKKAIIKYNL
jgi:hypothetical protein